MQNKPQGIERRFISASIAKIEKRTAEDGKVIVRGYTALFNTLSEDLGGFREQIDPAFFNGVLKDDVRALFNHMSSLILGRTTAKTLRIGVDSTGLWFEYDDPGTSYSQDLLISMERGDVTQCSFAFRLNYNIQADKWEKQGDGSYVRTLLVCDKLYDVGPVTYPAYTDTSVGQRSLDSFEEFKKINAQPAFDYKRSVARVKLSA